MFQIGWLSTGRDKAARDLLAIVVKNIRDGLIKAGIAFVFCSREKGDSHESDLFIQMVAEYRIPLICYSFDKFKARQGKTATMEPGKLPSWRQDYDRQVMKRLDDFHSDILVMAGYMLIISDEMCHKYNIINIHPAAPWGPKGTWQEVIWQLMEKQAQETGVMMHLVTPTLDRGPVATYCTFAIKGEPFDSYWDEIKNHSVSEIRQREGEKNRLFRIIREHGLRREFPLIVATLRAFGSGEVRVTADKKIVDAQGNPISGYDLTDEINKVIQ